MAKATKSRRTKRPSSSLNSRVLSHYPPYPGYYKDPSDRTNHEKSCELIHRVRRQVALHSYAYYELSQTLIHDIDYEIMVQKLLLSQLLYPRASEEVLFMRDVFILNDFESTGFHIAKAVHEAEAGEEGDAFSIQLVFDRMRANPKVNFYNNHVSAGANQKLSRLVSKVRAVKQKLNLD